jgi:hypothetical protein
MNKSTLAGLTFVAIVLVVAGLFFEAWLLGLILSWFGVVLTFWQNFSIIFLANLIFKNTSGSK